MTVSIRRHQVRISDGLDYTVLFIEGALLFVMFVGDEHMIMMFPMCGVEL